MDNYRQIWINENGEIPKDEHGRTYEIHHINGDSSDNRIENLECLSLQDHYNTHYERGDYAACVLIATRLNKSKKEISHLASAANRKRVKNGTHHLLGGEIGRKVNKERVANGTHQLLGGKIISDHWEECRKDPIKWKQRCDKNRHPGNGKNFNQKGMVNVVDIDGNACKLTVEEYWNQKGTKDEWEFVQCSSKEAKRRRNAKEISDSIKLFDDGQFIDRRVPRTGFESDDGRV